MIDYFRPSGRVLEPCRASGCIFRYLPAGADLCEIKDGRDFLKINLGNFDWVITSPPWSQFRAFLRRSMLLADDVVFLMTVSHIWTKARLRDVEEAKFGLKTILLVPTPSEFPQSGFQLGAVHVSRGWRGGVQLDKLLPAGD